MNQRFERIIEKVPVGICSAMCYTIMGNNRNVRYALSWMVNKYFE